jgi:hypothetical protein
MDAYWEYISDTMFQIRSERRLDMRKMGVGLNKEEAEYVAGLYNWDEMWDYLQDHNIKDERITRLGKRIEKSIKAAVAEEMI